MFKFILITLALCAGCHDALLPLDGYDYPCDHGSDEQPVAPALMPEPLTETELTECRADVDFTISELETLEAEKAAWLLERDELTKRLNMKNYTISEMAWTTCEVWINSVDGQCDLQIVDLGSGD